MVATKNVGHHFYKKRSEEMAKYNIAQIQKMVDRLAEIGINIINFF